MSLSVYPNRSRSLVPAGLRLKGLEIVSNFSLLRLRTTFRPLWSIPRGGPERFRLRVEKEVRGPPLAGRGRGVSGRPGLEELDERSRRPRRSEVVEGLDEVSLSEKRRRVGEKVGRFVARRYGAVVAERPPTPVVATSSESVGPAEVVAAPPTIATSALRARPPARALAPGQDHTRGRERWPSTAKQK